MMSECEEESLQSAKSYSSSFRSQITTAFSLRMFSSLYYTRFYSIFNSSLSHLFFQTSSSLQWFQHPSCLFWLVLHSSLVCSSTSLPTPPLPLLFPLPPSFLTTLWQPGLESQGYMWYRVRGGGPGFWALWQRQQVLHLPYVCLYPQICPPDTSHLLPKYITESFLLSIPLSLFTASHQI